MEFVTGIIARSISSIFIFFSLFEVKTSLVAWQQKPQYQWLEAHLDVFIDLLPSSHLLNIYK